jgi:RNA polymerase sigma factor (sigma-70 family)
MKPSGREVLPLPETASWSAAAPIPVPSSRSWTVAEWLDSPYLARVAFRVAAQFGIPGQDRLDLLQELRLALWKAGPGVSVNATWVFHTANHKAIDLIRGKRRFREESLSVEERVVSRNAPDPGLLHLLNARAGLLPRRLREFYSLRFREGLSQREIAKRLGLCRGSTRCLERRCLRMMKGRLAG